MDYKKNKYEHTEDVKSQIEYAKKMHEDPTKNGFKKLNALADSVVKTPFFWELAIFLLGIIILSTGLTGIAAGDIDLVLGIVLCIIGGLVISVAKFIYELIYEKKKKKHAAEILKLVEALSKDKSDEHCSK